MMNLWNPAYAFLSRYAADRGCEVILTGNGGDEWLEAGVHDATARAQRLDFVTFYRVWACMQRSYPLLESQDRPNLLWTFGMRPILRQGAAGVARAAQLRSTRPAGAVALRAGRRRPGWHRIPSCGSRCSSGTGRTSARHSRGALDSPNVAFELEEFYESGRRQGVLLLHPFWDADLTAFLALSRRGC